MSPAALFAVADAAALPDALAKPVWTPLPVGLEEEAVATVAVAAWPPAAVEDESGNLKRRKG